MARTEIVNVNRREEGGMKKRGGRIGERLPAILEGKGNLREGHESTSGDAFRASAGSEASDTRGVLWRSAVWPETHRACVMHAV